MRRLIIATMSGILCGFICLGLATSGPGVLPLPVKLQIVFSRALIGFAIGISRFPIGHWTIHGTLMGMFFSLPLAFSGMMAPESPDYSQSAMLFMTVILGMIYGLLIEFAATVIFNARQRS
ncbi:hypothetical protein JW905_13730 [bacterium]|nr:hypothetical protein [candidate division CSSED10-310 bacterium]